MFKLGVCVWIGEKTGMQCLIGDVCGQVWSQETYVCYWQTSNPEGNLGGLSFDGYQDIWV